MKQTHYSGKTGKDQRKNAFSHKLVFSNVIFDFILQFIFNFWKKKLFKTDFFIYIMSNLKE